MHGQRFLPGPTTRIRPLSASLIRSDDDAAAAAVDDAGPHHHGAQRRRERRQHHVFVRRAPLDVRRRIERRILFGRLDAAAQHPDAGRVDEDARLAVGLAGLRLRAEHGLERLLLLLDAARRRLHAPCARPRRRPSRRRRRSSAVPSSPMIGVAPLAGSRSAFSGSRASAVTRWPPLIIASSTADPMYPVAPVRNTCIAFRTHLFVSQR